MRLLILLNLSLLVLFPLAWAAPLMRAGLLPLFGLDEISVLSGIAALWPDEPFLAVVIVAFALVAPMVKTLALVAIQLGRLPARALPITTFLGKLAMADVFLIALYIVVAKGVGVGRIETAWGLWLFTFCILASLGISHATARAMART